MTQVVLTGFSKEYGNNISVFAQLVNGFREETDESFGTKKCPLRKVEGTIFEYLEITYKPRWAATAGGNRECP